MVLTSAHKTEDDSLLYSDKPKSFAEIVWILHLRQKAEKGDLANESIVDIEQGIYI